MGPIPWREDKWRKLGAMAFAVVVAIVLGLGSRQVGMGLAAWCAVTMAMWPVWLPVRYRLSRQGVEQWIFGWQRRLLEWRHVSSWSWHHHGVYLRGRSSRRWLPGYFAVFIPWQDAQSDIISMLEYYVIAGHRREGSTRSHPGTEVSADNSSHPRTPLPGPPAPSQTGSIPRGDEPLK